MSISSTKLSVIVMFLCFSIGAAVTAASIGSAGDESEHHNKITARFDTAALIVVASWIEKLTGRPVTPGPDVTDEAGNLDHRRTCNRRGHGGSVTGVGYVDLDRQGNLGNMTIEHARTNARLPEVSYQEVVGQT